MLIDTILLSTFAVHSEEAANRHASFIILMEEPTGVAFHAEAAEPVAADGLAEAAAGGGGGGGGEVGGGGGGGGDGAVGRDGGGEGGGVGGERGGGRGGDGGEGVEAALEIEAEDSFGVVHGGGR